MRDIAMTLKLKPLPIGIQTFKDIIDGQFLYIDKTAHINKLIKGKGLYFLSRPRRFGKSLLLTTLEAFFLGKKELFKGLAIEKLDHDWQEYPVIRLDISAVGHDDETMVAEGLIKRLVDAAKPYSIILNTNQPPHEVFNDLIKLVAEKTGKKLVVLIDEYDSPIVNQLHNHELVKNYFAILRDFYRVTKFLDDKLQFVFVTGVSNFAKANMFSGLNHLDNITLNSKYAEICGYTQEELEHYFADRITKLANELKEEKTQTLKQIQAWYNGYQFVEKNKKVYNPFSILQLFNNMSFRNYWYQTGTPSFLVKAIGNVANLQPMQFENYKASQEEFDTLVVENPKVLPLLFQTGYLTIKGYQPADNIYELGYPNTEVRQSFMRSLLAFYVDDDLAASHVYHLAESIRKNDLNSFMDKMKIFFANVPYDIQIPLEKYYQTIFYLILKLLGYYIEVEVKTNQGRIDAVLATKTNVYIIEFKLNGTAIEALQQIENGDYATRYRNHGKEMTLMGVEFSFDKRTLIDWKVKVIPAL